MYTDGSASTFGGARYAGWGVYDYEGHYTAKGPVVGKEQTVARAEVRALVEVAEAVRQDVIVYCDNKYAVDASTDVLEGRGAVDNQHKDLWDRFAAASHYIKEVRWIKSHMTKETAEAKGVPEVYRIGNEMADVEAKAGAEEHGYTSRDKAEAKAKAGRVGRIQRHILDSYIKYLNCEAVIKDGKQHRAATRFRVRTQKRGRPKIAKDRHGHTIEGDEEAEFCRPCGRITKAADKHGFWIKNKCEPTKRLVDVRRCGHTIAPGGREGNCAHCDVRGRNLENRACNPGSGKRRGGPLQEGAGPPPVKRARPSGDLRGLVSAVG